MLTLARYILLTATDSLSALTSNTLGGTEQAGSEEVELPDREDSQRIA